jgi:hypothetical protein
MDRTVADEAELKMVVLAVGPVQSVQHKPLADQVDALALTVWPTLLSPAIEAEALVQTRDPRAAQLLPRGGEDIATYLLRVCGGPLSSDCKDVVPEAQGAVVYGLALRKATERARNAVASCISCDADPGWHEAVHVWEDLDRQASATIVETQRRADPDNWPLAGPAAENDPRLPEADLTLGGELLIGGQSYEPADRVRALRDLRGDGVSLALHVRPEASLAQVRAILDDATKAGAKHVAVIARVGSYPWDRKAYWIADGTGTSAGLRPTDSLQLLLHAIDAVAAPGTVARVD